MIGIVIPGEIVEGSVVIKRCIQQGFAARGFLRSPAAFARRGDTVVIVRRQRFQGADVFVVHQLDGTLAHIPCWMMNDAAACHKLSSEPRLPIEHLPDLAD